MSEKSPYKLFGIECKEGWKGLYEPLIEMCEKEGVEIFQIKEKFGGLRFYTNGGESVELQMAIITAEDESYHVCEVCGEEGKTKLQEGWAKTLCNACEYGNAFSGKKDK